MFGTRQYRLPNAKRTQPPKEAVEPIESGEVEGLEKLDEEPLDGGDFDQEYYQDEESYEENGQAMLDDDEYYFEAEEEPVKAPAWKEPIIESNRSDVATFSDLEQLMERDSGDKEEEVKEAVKRSYNARDEGEPLKSPPGFVWAHSTVSSPGTWTGERLLNLLGIGDAAQRFRVKTEEEEMTPPEYLALGGGNAEKKKRAWLEKKKEELEKKKILAAPKEEAEEDEEGAEKKAFNISELEAAEPAEGPRGWMFWNGPRWQHWWYGYETPTSWTGYPVQWFYRGVHLFFPETFDSDELSYEPTAGEIRWKTIPENGWWMLTHPCLKQIILNMILITPLAILPILRRRFKIIRNRITFHRTVLTNVIDHLPILLRRLRFRAVKKYRRRYWRWTAFFTFAFAPNCWDLLGHQLDNPTEDFWEKNYIQNYTDGIKTSADDLSKWLALQPPKNKGITTKPNLDALRKHENALQQLKASRQALRDQKFDPNSDPESDWKSLFKTETEARKSQIQRKFDDSTRLKLLDSGKDKL
jgi:hypothetical protein